MTDPPLRVRKAFAYITRGDALLVFTHRDFPLLETGVQVPAGTIRDGETPAAAAAREAVEETGLESLTLVRNLGTASYDVRPGRHEVHERHFFHFLADEGVPDRWIWHEEHDGLEAPTMFEFFWIPLAHAHVLSAGMGALIAQIDPQRNSLSTKGS